MLSILKGSGQVIPLLFLFTFTLRVQLANASTLSETASATASASQTGYYKLWNSGNTHGWVGDRSPSNPSAFWHLTWDLSTVPSQSSIGSATINTAWKVNAPNTYPIEINYAGETTGAFPGSSRQPIKYMTVNSDSWLTDIKFSDGYVYSLGSSRQNPGLLNLIALGLLPHLEDSHSVSLEGELVMSLGRAYLDDADGNDWQHANGWADWITSEALGTATANASGTLNLNFIAPSPPVASTPEPTSLSLGALGSALIALATIRRLKNR